MDPFAAAVVALPRCPAGATACVPGRLDTPFFRAPIASALAYADGAIYGTDSGGGVYSIDAATGLPGNEDLAGDNPTGGAADWLSVAPPAVDPSSQILAVVKDGYGTLCLDGALTLDAKGGFCLPPSEYRGQLTAPTIVPTRPGCAAVWENTDQGTLFEVRQCSHGFSKLQAAPTGVTAGHNFSALDVGVGPGSQYVLAWSDQAAALPGARLIPYRLGAEAGAGLEVWALRTPLDVWADVQPAVAGGRECIVAAALPGAFAAMAVRWGGKTYALHHAGSAFGSPLALPSGCPAPRTPWEAVAGPGGLWGVLRGEWGHPAAGGGDRALPLTAGNVPPQIWEVRERAAWPTAQLWVAAVPVGAPRGGTEKATVTGTEPSGLMYRPGSIAVRVRCPSGTQLNASGGVCTPAVFGVAWLTPNPAEVGQPQVLDVLAPSSVASVRAAPPGGGTLSLSQLGGGVYQGVALQTPPGATGPLYTSRRQGACGYAQPLAFDLYAQITDALQCFATSFKLPAAEAEERVAYFSDGNWGPPRASPWDGRRYRLWRAAVGALRRAGAVEWSVSEYSLSPALQRRVQVLHPWQFAVCPPGKVAGAGGSCAASPAKKRRTTLLLTCPQPIPGVDEGPQSNGCCPDGKLGVYPRCYWTGQLPPQHAIGVFICGTLGPHCQSWMQPGHGSYRCWQGMRFCRYGPQGTYPPPSPTQTSLLRFLRHKPGCEMARRDEYADGTHGEWFCARRDY